MDSTDQKRWEKPNTNNTTARLLKHLGSKLGLFPQSQILRLPASMSLGEEDGQNVTDDGVEVVWEQNKASVPELDGSINKGIKPFRCPFIGAVEFAQELKRAGFYPTTELEAQPIPPLKPPGSRQWTSYNPVPAELSDGFDHHQPLELDGSNVFHSNTEHRWSSSKPYFNDDNPHSTYPNYISVLPAQLLQCQVPIKEQVQEEITPRFSGTAPSRFTLPQHGSSSNKFPIIAPSIYSPEQSPLSNPDGSFSAPATSYADRHLDPMTTKRNCVSLQPGQRSIGWPLNGFPQAPTTMNCNRSMGQETAHGDYVDQFYNDPTSKLGMITPYAFWEPDLSSSLTLPRSDLIPGPYGARKRTLCPVPLFSEDEHHKTDNQEQLWLMSPLGSQENDFTSSSIVSPLSSDGAQAAFETHFDEGQPSPLIPVAAPGPSKPLPPLPLSNRSSGETSQTSPSTQPTSTEVSPVSADFTTSTTNQSRKARGVSNCLQCGTEFNGSFQDRKANLKRHVQYCHGRQEKFKCPINGCTKEYSRPDNLMKHRRFVHEDVLPLRRSNAHKVRRSF
ncbi:MAG: hypothetical protein Q9226_000001 [Calogaya cf. arnoldii]